MFTRRRCAAGSNRARSARSKFGDHIGTIRIPREQVEALLRRVAAGGRSAATQGSRNGPGTVRHSQAPSHS